MQPKTVTKLLAINHQFYQTFAGEFAATRMRLQPGVMRVLETIPPDARILDLGCGNGELGRELLRRGHRALYVGLDFSAELLANARQGIADCGFRISDFRFQIADLSAPDWDAALPAPFDIVLAFAVLHHLPPPLHRQLCQKVHALLAPATPSPPIPISPPISPSPLAPRFIHSNWQFLNSPRWQARVQPWESVGLSPDDTGPNEYLLDWRRGGTGYRYVHHFSEAGLAELAADTGFRVVETFHSDGKEGNLGVYSVWEGGVVGGTQTSGRKQDSAW